MYSLILLLVVGAATVSGNDNTAAESSFVDRQKELEQLQRSLSKDALSTLANNDAENIIIAVSQGFAYLLKHLKGAEDGLESQLESHGFTPYVTAIALTLLLLLKLFTSIKKYWRKNEAGGESGISVS